jgi:hypothetical protein
MNRILGLRVAGAIFALVCLAQLVRLTKQIEVIAGGHRIPFWPSAVVLVITGGMSLWLWTLSKPETK